ncbi:(2,3-dihydroxybenzoyl)adenylate synthase [Anaerocolumna xylanovorans]|uniref:Yersiniabactin salicyl-AMP ligase n=1 Tax=Anaerocolumna xylanovorans DSM 12503 TaxID=1121345 RepID=A0A1M7YI58_9FIRM|nr:AMP-binding protein [Anaerocolumna xylanovorans]SHO52307.1 yersiniabactin salicyl-AMP ligase [Anaerocolumna xylanovorans DSM 12503]
MAGKVYGIDYNLIMDWQFKTYGDKLREWSELYPKKVAIIDENEELTYYQLKERVFSTAIHLLKLGICKGDRIILQLPNCNEFVVAAFALFEIGAIPIMLLPAHREHEIGKIIELAQPVAYITYNNFLSFNYGDMARKLQQGTEIKFIIDNIDSVSKRYSHEELSKFLYEKPVFSDTAMLLLSGGTTGIPKLIPRTHGDYIYTNYKLAKRCQLSEDSVYLAVLPAPHNFPWGNPGILGTLSVGGTVIMSQYASPDIAFLLIEKYSVTFTSLVPALLSMYLEVIEWDDTYDISSLQFVMVGGSFLEKGIAGKVYSLLGCKLVNIYGLAEGLNTCTSLTDTKEVVISTQGKPISEFDEIRIIDEEGNEVPNGEYGELITRGPYTLQGYYKLPEINKERFTEEGFFCTGDKARISKDGNIQVIGRVREQINRAGEKIIPSEIEEYICEHQDIRECVVVGLPDNILGTRTCACVITDNNDLTHDEIRGFLESKGVTKYKIPDQLEIMDFWPLTAVNKIDKDQIVKDLMKRV